MNTPFENKEDLLKLVSTKMPFGRFEGRLLCDLPVSYLEWFDRKGWPKGKLGDQLNLTLTIKANGLEHLFDGLKKLAHDR